VIIYAGNIGFSQGLDDVLRAAKILETEKHIIFVLIGDGPALEGLKSQAATMNLLNVMFLPFQPCEYLPEVLATADLTLISLLSGVGVGSLQSKTFSYLAGGRAILAITDEGNDLWQLIERSESGRCILPGRPELLAEAIHELAGSPDVLKVLGKNGREYMVAHHSRRSASRQFEQLFQEIVH